MSTRRREHRRYKIGDWVWVTSTVEFEYDDKRNRIMSKKFADWCGKVCGLRQKRTGKVELGYDYVGESGIGFSLDSPEPTINYLTDIKVHKLWEVRRGLMNNPVLVAEEDMHLIPTQEADDLKLPMKHEQFATSMYDKLMALLDKKKNETSDIG